jgi:hypothetical protein
MFVWHAYFELFIVVLHRGISCYDSCGSVHRYGYFDIDCSIFNGLHISFETQIFYGKENNAALVGRYLAAFVDLSHKVCNHGKN